LCTRMNRFVALTLLCSWSSLALTLQSNEKAAANPIRKVVTLLQDMQAEITAEGEKEKDLFDKFMCYCNGNTDGMSKSAADAGQAIVELQSKLEAEKAEKSQLDQELIQHKQDREAAKNDLATATSIREKEHQDYVDATGDQKANLDALNGALSALEKGMGKSFLQSGSERLMRLRKVAQSASIDDYDRSSVLSFLSGKQNPFGDYGAQSGEIVGILKAMRDEMDKDLNGVVSDEKAAAASFEGTSAAKKAEIQAASEAIESKTERTGALAVSIVTTKNDIEDTTAEMSDTQAFLANLKAQCETKKKEWAQRSQLRAEEIKAISEVIAILNDDDALDIFKKTLSLSQAKSSMAFLQRRSATSVARRARDILSAQKGTAHATQLALIENSLKAKAVDFTKVLKMVDDMQALLATEQTDDDNQMSFCEKDLDRTATEKADTESAIAASAALIEETESASATLADEVAQLQKDVKALDAAVADATEQRKNEHGEYVQFQTENNAALQLIEKAKNRLFKLYRPNLYKEAPKQELTDEEKILASSGRSDLIATTAEPGFMRVRRSGRWPSSRSPRALLRRRPRRRGTRTRRRTVRAMA